MKKILLTATLLVGLSAMSNAQDKGVGINTTTPKASLDVATTSDNTMPDAVLVPRFSLTQLQAKNGAYLADQNGALVFVNDISTGTPSGKTVNITATGFYYYDSIAGEWKTLGGGGSAVDTSLYLNDGTLGGNRVVTQNANNLTFTNTGAGRFIVNGTQQNTGAVYMKTRSHSGPLVPSTWAADDYNIVVSGTTAVFALPNASQNVGRVVSITNQTGAARGWDTNAENRYENAANLGAAKGAMFISIGTTWQMIGGF